MRATSLQCVLDLARRDERVVFIGSDLGHGALQEFKNEFPERFFMEGISEAYIVGMATGLALEGKIPYVHTIGTFLTRRCFEQLVDDVCLHNVPVRLIGGGGGFVYAPLGPTHMAIEDLAILRAIPNMTVVAPADADEMRRLMPLTLDYPGPIYIRLAKGGDPIVTDPAHGFKIGTAIPMLDGRDVLFITTGIALGIALAGASMLEKIGVSCGVLHVHTIKPIDATTVLEHVAAVRAVITIEEHTIVGGLGSAVAELIAEADLPSLKAFRRVGVPDVFPDQYGSQASLLERYSITPQRVVDLAATLLGRDAQSSR